MGKKQIKLLKEKFNNIIENIENLKPLIESIENGDANGDTYNYVQDNLDSASTILFALNNIVSDLNPENKVIVNYDSPKREGVSPKRAPQNNTDVKTIHDEKPVVELGTDLSKASSLPTEMFFRFDDGSLIPFGDFDTDLFESPSIPVEEDAYSVNADYSIPFSADKLPAVYKTIADYRKAERSTGIIDDDGIIMDLLETTVQGEELLNSVPACDVGFVMDRFVNNKDIIRKTEFEDVSEEATKKKIESILNDYAKKSLVSADSSMVKTIVESLKGAVSGVGFNNVLGYVSSSESGNTAKYIEKLKLKENPPSDYPEDTYNSVSGLANFGGKGVLMSRLQCLFEQLKDEKFDLFVDLFSGSCTVGANQEICKTVLCNDANGIAMLSNIVLAKGADYFFEKIPEIVESFFAMPENFYKWEAIQDVVKMYKEAIKMLQKHFSVDYGKDENWKNRKTKTITLKTSVDDLHTDVVEIYQSEWFNETKNCAVIDNFIDLVEFLESEEQYKKLLNKDITMVEKAYNVVFACTYPLYRIIFDTFSALHSAGKTNIIVYEYQVPYSALEAVNQAVIVAEHDFKIYSKENESYLNDKTNKNTEEYNEIKKEKKAREQLKYDFETLRNGCYKKYHYYYTIPESIVEYAYYSETTIVLTYLYRLSVSHMGAGMRMSTTKFDNFYDGLFEIKAEIDSAISNNMDANDSLVKMLGSSYKNRYRRLYNFAHKLSNHNVLFTSYDYSVILKKVIPQLLDEGYKILAYIDPPYVGTSQYYGSKMAIDEHREMLKILDEIKHPNLTAIISMNEDSIGYYHNSIDYDSDWIMYSMGSVLYESLKDSLPEDNNKVEYALIRAPKDIKEMPCRVKNTAEISFIVPTSDKDKSDFEKYNFPAPIIYPAFRNPEDAKKYQVPKINLNDKKRSIFEGIPEEALMYCDENGNEIPKEYIEVPDYIPSIMFKKVERPE